MTKPTANEAWAAIAALPGKTVKPWQDGDAREHCSHCVLCAECYPTRVLGQHTAECASAILLALTADKRLTDALAFLARGFRVEAAAVDLAEGKDIWLEAARRVERSLGAALDQPAATLAHALANPPGPRGAREMFGAYDTLAEYREGLEPQGALPRSFFGYTDKPCQNCGLALIEHLRRPGAMCPTA